MPTRSIIPHLVVVLALLGGCREESAPPSMARPPERTSLAPRALQVVPAPGEVADPTAPDPLLDALGDAVPTPEEEAAAEAMPSPLAAQHPPSRGCALQTGAPQRLLLNAGPPAIISTGDGFLVAAYDQQGVAVVRARPGALPQPYASVPLPSPRRTARPGFARTDAREATLAMIDGGGRVLVATLDPTMPAQAPLPREIAEGGADARFAPSIRAVGTRRAVAWTNGAQTPMRLELAIVDAARVIARHDVTPAAGGGAAPIFLEGEDPVLLFVDARDAITVAHRVRLGPDGEPGPIEVMRPLNLSAAPPAFAAGRAPRGARTWLAYAAIGNGATRAVGLVDATGSERPAPLVPGVGYGSPLTIDAVGAGRSVVFAIEAPTAAESDAPHEVRLRVVDDDGAGDPLVVAAPGAAPSIARGADGLLAVAYRAGETVFVHYARCAE